MNMKKRLTVAAIYPTYGGGGVPAVGKLATLLDSERFRVIHIFLKSKGGRKDSFTVDGQQFYCLSGKKKLHALSVPMLLKLVAILKDEKVDIIHAHRHKPCFYGVLAQVITKTPVILFHVHGLGRTKNLGRKILNMFMFKRVNKIIGCANSVREDVIKTNFFVKPEKVIALRNSIDFEKFQITLNKADARIKHLPELPKDAIIFGMIARFGPYKGHSYLVKAFKEVRWGNLNAHLVFIGKGPLKKQILGQVIASGLLGHVHFLGYRQDVPELLKAIDVFVLPSVGSEGMPLVLLEAMAAGVPCIATKLSGIPEIIDTDEVGCLVPMRDEKALAKAMTEFAKMPQANRDQIIEKASDRVRQHFNHNVVSHVLKGIYETEYKS